MDPAHQDRNERAGVETMNVHPRAANLQIEKLADAMELGVQFAFVGAFAAAGPQRCIRTAGAASGPPLTDWPSRSRARATAVASRSSPIAASRQACMPRSDIASPRAGRIGADPRRRGRTAREAVRHQFFLRGGDVRRPASTSRCHPRGGGRVAFAHARGRAGAVRATEGPHNAAG